MRSLSIISLLLLTACHSDFDKGSDVALLRVVRLSACEIAVSSHVDQAKPFRARIISDECNKLELAK